MRKTVNSKPYISLGELETEMLNVIGSYPIMKKTKPYIMRMKVADFNVLNVSTGQLKSCQ